MVITNYSFFSGILNENFFSPIRWFVENGVSHPLKGTQYFSEFRNFFIQIIKENKIKVIYTIKPVHTSFIEEILGEKCVRTSNISKMLDAHKVLDCAKIG